MELQQLRYALAVIDTGSFTVAARQCFVAQPSLSQSIRNLERELGVELFERIGRSFIVSAAGAAFADAARSALRAVENVRIEVDAVSGLVVGHLDLVALPTLAVEPVSPLVGAFRTAHPGVVVRLAHPDGTADLVRAVRQLALGKLRSTQAWASAGETSTRTCLRLADAPLSSSTLRRVTPS